MIHLMTGDSIITQTGTTGMTYTTDIPPTDILTTIIIIGGIIGLCTIVLNLKLK
jgi:hypothetical protein